MSHSNSRIIRAALPLILLLAAGWSGCSSHRHSEAGITLGSGLDKKVSSMDDGTFADSSTGYSTQLRSQVQDSVSFGELASTPPSTGPAPGRPGTTYSSSSDPRQLSAFPDIDSWLLPKAYAQDHQISEKYLIRNGTLEFKLDNLDSGQTAANGIAAKHGGTVTNTSIQKNNSGYRSGTITLRIPSDKFLQVWSELLALKGAEVISQNIETQDVGAQYVSQISRMKALAREQETLQTMLDEALAVQRSRGLGEAYKVLLDTQSRLSEVTAEIQGVEDRVKALADQITRSTITLSLTENPKIPVAKPDSFSWGLGTTFNSAVRDLMEAARGFAQGLIYFVVTLQWVWWLLFFFAARWAWRHYKKIMPSQKQNPAKPAAQEK